MTLPQAPRTSTPAGQEAPAAGSLLLRPQPLQTLRLRADFLKAARARHKATPGFVLQWRVRDDANGPIRVGFTCSKKVGNAVARNRAKRRLREVARLVLPDLGRSGTDYVLIGRAGHTANRPFEALLDDLRNLLEQTQ